MVSSSIPQRPAGEAEPMIRKKPPKAVPPPPPRVRQRVTEVPGTAVSKELTPPASALALICLDSEKETSQQLHCVTQMVQRGTGWVRAAFNHIFSIFTNCKCLRQSAACCLEDSSRCSLCGIQGDSLLTFLLLREMTRRLKLTSGLGGWGRLCAGAEHVEEGCWEPVLCFVPMI